MIHLVSKYLTSYYKAPACFALVSDFYKNELNFPFEETDLVANNKLGLQRAFAISIHKNKLFKTLDLPKNGCLVLFYKKSNLKYPEHIGIFIENAVLHHSETLVLFEELFIMKDRWDKVEYKGLRDAY